MSAERDLNSSKTYLTLQYGHRSPSRADVQTIASVRKHDKKCKIQEGT